MLALVLFLILAATVYGLGLASMWVSTAHPLTAHGSIESDHDAEVAAAKFRVMSGVRTLDLHEEGI